MDDCEDVYCTRVALEIRAAVRAGDSIWPIVVRERAAARDDGRSIASRNTIALISEVREVVRMQRAIELALNHLDSDDFADAERVLRDALKTSSPTPASNGESESAEAGKDE